MKRSTHWLVADYGIRPAGPPDRCFYCDAQMGQEHVEGCVIRERTVVVRFHVDLVMGVPETWDGERIRSFHNSGTWCANNLAREMADAISRMDKSDGCLCPAVTVEFLREATEEDELAQNLRANDLPH